MAYIEVQNAKIPPNDPRNQGRFPHKATIIMVTTRENQQGFLTAMRLQDERRLALREFLQDHLDGDYTLSFGDTTIRGQYIPIATVCCRDVNWIMMAMLMEQQWIGNHTYMVESVK